MKKIPNFVDADLGLIDNSTFRFFSTFPQSTRCHAWSFKQDWQSFPYQKTGFLLNLIIVAAKWAPYRFNVDFALEVSQMFELRDFLSQEFGLLNDVTLGSVNHHYYQFSQGCRFRSLWLSNWCSYNFFLSTLSLLAHWNPFSLQSLSTVCQLPSYLTLLSLWTASFHHLLLLFSMTF